MALWLQYQNLRLESLLIYLTLKKGTLTVVNIMSSKIMKNKNQISVEMWLTNFYLTVKMKINNDKT